MQVVIERMQSILGRMQAPDINGPQCRDALVFRVDAIL